MPDPSHLPTERLDHHRGVTVALVRREFVHRRISNLRPIRFGNAGSPTRFVDRFDGMRIQTVERCNGLDIGRLEQNFPGIGKACHDPPAAPAPVQRLRLRPTTVLAPKPTTRHMQHHAIFKQRKIPNPAPRRLVDLRATLAALLAQHHSA